MKCWSCNHELIWGGDHDTEWEDNDEEQHMVMTNLSCPNCTAEVIVYHCNVVMPVVKLIKKPPAYEGEKIF